MDLPIPTTPENLQKIAELGERLLGTCEAADTFISEIFGEDVSLTDLDMPLLEALDDTTLQCEVCGWWCETGFVNDEGVCDECEPMEESE